MDWDGYNTRLEGARAANVAICGSTKDPNPALERTLIKGHNVSLSRKIFMMRRRLSQLTGPDAPLLSLPVSIRNWPDEMAAARNIASCLAKTILRAADNLFSGTSKLSGAWKDALSFQWRLQCVNIGHCHHSAPIYLKIWRKSVTERWETDGDSLNAVLGLILWSIQADPGANLATMRATRPSPPITCRIVSAGASSSRVQLLPRT